MSSLARRIAPTCALAVALTAALAGCEARRVMAGVEAVEPPAVATAPWPQLVTAPDPDAARADAPDPAAGAAVADALRREAAAATVEAERLAVPVFDVERLRTDAAAVRAAP